MDESDCERGSVAVPLVPKVAEPGEAETAQRLGRMHETTEVAPCVVHWYVTSPAKFSVRCARPIALQHVCALLPFAFN